MTDIARLPAAEIAELPWLTVAQMVEVDRAMVEDYEILLPQMMEHAGRHLAHLARERFLGGALRGRHVAVLAGPGGNGGGALVAARRLAAWGATVTVVVSAESERMADVPRHQRRILEHMQVPLSEAAPPPGRAFDLILDGLIGYSLSGRPRGRAADLIRWANAHAAPVLSLDVPSGLDATTGEVIELAARATATMTLALPKRGLGQDLGPTFVGELYLADIGVPPALYAEPPLALTVPPVFARADLVRLR